MDLSTVFAWIVPILSALAVIGALVFTVVWEVCAIRRTLAQHRLRQLDPSTRYWSDRSAVTVPERRP
jgi:hypothetical protein